MVAPVSPPAPTFVLNGESRSLGPRSHLRFIQTLVLWRFYPVQRLNVEFNSISLGLGGSERQNKISFSTLTVFIQLYVV